jgi:hypothetical protein
VTLQYERGKLVARSRLEKVFIDFDLAREIDHNTVFLKTNLISSYSHSSLPKLSQLTALTHEPSDRRSNLATSQKNSTAYTEVPVKSKGRWLEHRVNALILTRVSWQCFHTVNVP